MKYQIVVLLILPLLCLFAQAPTKLDYNVVESDSLIYGEWSLYARYYDCKKCPNCDTGQTWWDDNLSYKGLPREIVKISANSFEFYKLNKNLEYSDALIESRDKSKPADLSEYIFYNELKSFVMNDIDSIKIYLANDSILRTHGYISYMKCDINSYLKKSNRLGQ